MNILIQLYNFISLATTSWICETIIEFKIWKIFFNFPARKPTSMLGRAFSKYIYRSELFPKIFLFAFATWTWVYLQMDFMQVKLQFLILYISVESFHFPPIVQIWTWFMETAVILKNVWPQLALSEFLRNFVFSILSKILSLIFLTETKF